MAIHFLATGKADCSQKGASRRMRSSSFPGFWERWMPVATGKRPAGKKLAGLECGPARRRFTPS